MAGGRDWTWLKTAAAIVVTQVVFAGMNIMYKLALKDGMDYRVVIAYRYIFATALFCPIAFFIERKRRSKLTVKILWLSFLNGLFGAGLAQLLYIASMNLTSATYTSAFANLIPSLTFVLAVLLRLEKLAIRTTYGKAKVMGTLIGLGGATLITFYHGPEVKIWATRINLFNLLPHGSQGQPLAAAEAHHPDSTNLIIGSLLAILSCLCYAIWLILQAKLAPVYPFPYSCAALMCLMGSIQTSIFAASFKRDKADWRLGFNVRLIASVYSGALSSGLAFTLLNWCIKKKGPLYASTFNPLMLVVVAILSSLLIDEKLYLGCLLGAGLIVIGLYMVLWGKGMEASKVPKESTQESLSETLNVVVVAYDNPEEDKREKEAEEEKEKEFEKAKEAEEEQKKKELEKLKEAEEKKKEKEFEKVKEIEEEKKTDEVKMEEEEDQEMFDKRPSQKRRRWMR